MVEAGYVPRLVDRSIAELFGELPALLLVGPRASGKTTTARHHARTVVRLDRQAERDAVAADPDAALRGLPEPILIDEWQLVPEVLGAVKRAVDADFRAARFILTGSVRAELEGPLWPGTGRIVRIPVYPMTVGELNRAIPDAIGGYFARLAEDDPEVFPAPADVPDLRGYVEMAQAGGFPEAVLSLSGKRRSAWQRSYIEQVATRDIPMFLGRRDPVRVARFIEALAINTAGVPTDKTLYTAAELNRATALDYERLLSDLYIADALPAWSTNRLKRLTRAPKRYLVDPSLVFATLGLDVGNVMRDGSLLGRVIDTFTVAQLRPQLVLDDPAPRLYHLRDRDGHHEIDIVAELGQGRVAALEIKAKASVSASDARHLAWLCDQLGERFVAGAVIHSGPRPFRLGERLLALPIWTLWS